MSEWIEWSGEGEYPETLDTVVHVKMRDGHVHETDFDVRFWCGNGPVIESSWSHEKPSPWDIVAYRIVS